MGCCVGGSLRDEEIDRASTMFELINVMKRKKENMAKESAEVEAYLQDPSNKLTMATFNGVTKEDLKKRPPYLAKLSHAYQEAIDRLQETPNLPFKETKEYMYNIVQHYYITYDGTEKFREDLAAFKKFVFEFQKKQNQ